MLLTSTSSWDGEARDWSGETIPAAVTYAVDLLGRSFEDCRQVTDRGEAYQWNALLNLTADAGGPWWPGPADNFRHLPTAERRWVTERVGRAAAKVAHWMCAEAREGEWQWIWTEVPLWTWSGTLPVTTRVDIMVGAGRGAARGYALDLKVTSRDFRSDDFQPSRSDLDSLRRYRRALEATSFPGAGANSLGLLYADAEGDGDCLADFTRAPKW